MHDPDTIHEAGLEPGAAGPRTVACRNPVQGAIAVTGLRMSYGAREVVAGVDLHVAVGEVFAFLGPNGAGKTTTVEILEGFRRRSGGEIEVLGQDPQHAGAEWRARIGVVLQESEPETELTASECVSLYAGYYPAPRPVTETLALVGLVEQASTPCGRLSGGQRRRLDVALALIGDPELLFLDEPTTGFDPSARHAAWDVIAGLRKLGKTIFLTTHDMAEAEYLADRIAIIVAGRIVAQGTPDSLGGRDRALSRVSFTLPPGVTAADLPPQLRTSLVPGAAGTDTGREPRIAAAVAAPLGFLATLAGWASERGLDLADLEVSRPTLEQIYLELTEPGS